MSQRNQRGQIIPFVVLFMFFSLIMVLVVIWIGTTAAFRAKAQAAADSAALAGAVEGEPAATRKAAENKAVLTKFEQLGNDVRVAVRLGNIAATARATNESISNNRSLAPALRAALARAESLARQKAIIVHSSNDTLEVTSGTGQWLKTLSDSTGLCEQSASVFVVCRG